MSPTRTFAAITPVRVAWKAAWAKAFDVMPPTVMFVGWLLALAVGAASGASLAGVPDVKAPHQCTVAFNVAEKAFVDYENQVVAIHNRATRGQEEFAQHDGDVAQLWDAIDAAKTDYRVAKAACLGGAR